MMRIFALFAFSFAAAVFTAVLLPWSGWYLWVAGILAVFAAGVLLSGKNRQGSRRAAIIFASAAAGLLYFTGFQTLLVQPVTENIGVDPKPFSVTVAEYPEAIDYGAKVTVRMGNGVKALFYGDDSILSLAPGQQVSGTARLENAANVNDDGIFSLNAKGIFVILYQQGEVLAGRDDTPNPLYWPQRFAAAAREQIRSIWDDPITQSYMVAEILGDQDAVPKEDYSITSRIGLAHVLFVAGFPGIFMIASLCICTDYRRRKLFCIASVVFLLFYMLISGLASPVVTSCIMQIFMLAALYANREKDLVPALAAALLLILLANPYAAGGIVLQMELAALLGLILVSGRFYRFLTKWYKGNKRPLRRLLFFVADIISVCLGMLVFTIPLTAFYYNVFTLIAPLSNLLVLPAAGWNLAAGLLSVLAGFICSPAGRIAGWVCWGLVHYIRFISHLLMRLPYHTLYFTSRYMKYWLAYAYVLLGICCLSKGLRRRYVLATVLAACTFLLTLSFSGREYRYGTMNALAVNVGQGECVLLYSGDDAVAVDCGSGNSYIDAGDCALDQMGHVGIKRLSALILTHYHADHANGVYDLLTRIPVDRLLLPDIEDEYGVRDRTLALAERYGVEVSFIYNEVSLPLGEAEMTVYPPLGADSMNEQGLTILCSAGDFDFLITGDMTGTTERMLIETYRLPDIEVLMVGHHGSRYSSSQEFLDTVKPETAIISVGYNTYGHPTQDVIARLRDMGAEVFRTDEQGSILVTVHGGDG